jgi:molecular chaperone GrpE
MINKDIFMSKKKNKEDLIEKDMDVESTFTDEEKEVEEETLDLDEFEQIRNKIANLEASVAEWKDKYLRSMADFDNYRRRSVEEKSDWIKRATEKLALSICDVVDNFDRALMQVTDEQKEDNFIIGIFMIDQQLKSALEKEGVKRVEALGHEFDPNFHEALANIPSDYEEGKVSAIIQNGYTMHGKLIRPVRVAVSTGKNDLKPNTDK